MIPRDRALRRVHRDGPAFDPKTVSLHEVSPAERRSRVRELRRLFIDVNGDLEAFWLVLAERHGLSDG